MSNKKQSSVEWLIAELGEYFPHEIGGIHLMVSKAKVMHKEEMIEFSQEVFRNRYNQVYQSLGNIADDKYKETFGGNDE